MNGAKENEELYQAQKKAVGCDQILVPPCICYPRLSGFYCHVNANGATGRMEAASNYGFDGRLSRSNQIWRDA